MEGRTLLPKPFPFRVTGASETNPLRFFLANNMLIASAGVGGSQLSNQAIDQTGESARSLIHAPLPPAECSIYPKKLHHRHKSRCFPFLSFDCHSSSCLRITEPPLHSMNGRIFRLHGSLSLSLVCLSLSLSSSQRSPMEHFSFCGTAIETISEPGESISPRPHTARWPCICDQYGEPQRSRLSATKTVRSSKR